MSDEPNSLEPLDSDPVEARIVAWVLGEASAFEAAELERLCKERPELLVFRRRMRALHGLLTEAEAAQPDESWKLPPEKRQVLDEIFGEEKPVQLAPVNEQRVRRSDRRALWGIAACLLLGVMVYSLINSGKWQFNDLESVSYIEASAVSRRSQAEAKEKAIVSLQEAIRDQEAKVEERRKVLTTIVRTKGIIYTGDDSHFRRSGVDDDQGARSAVEVYNNLEREKIQLESQIQSTLKYDSDQLMVYAAGIDSPDNIVRALYPQYLEKKREIEGLKNQGLSDKHPTLKSGTEDLEGMEEQMAEGVVNLRETLRAKLELTKNSLAKVEAINGDTREEAINRGLDAQDYADAKRDFEADRALLQEMKIKLISEQIALGAAGDEGALAKNESDVQAPFSSWTLAPSKSSTRGISDPVMDSAAGAIAYLESQPGVETEAQEEAGKKTDRTGFDAASELSESSGTGGADDKIRAETLAKIEKDWELYVPADSAPSAGAINRNNIDAVLSNPLPQAGAPASPAVAWNSQDEGTKSLKPAEIPAKEPAVPMDELTSSDSPYSTFSLNISDASFKLAKAALEKGERPDPAEVKVEQFYNAVDYGDPAPGAGEPVTGVVEQAAHPVIPGRNLVRVALRTAAAGRGASQPLRLTLLVDQSGSMVRDDRRAAMDRAVKQLAGLLTNEDRVTVIGFSRLPHLLAENLSGNEAAKLPGLLNQTADEGGTNLEEAMKLSAQMAERQQLAGAQNRIVLFTDGAANLGDADPSRLAEQVKALRQKGIAFDIAGIGADGLNDRTLSELARHGNGRYHVVVDGDDFARQLAGAFRPAAENVKVQVRFNPERVGKYKLVGFEKDRLKTEDFRNDKVDAGELAAEEAGVALYQVEPLAEGSGEIGEVSVRFRDTATGTMVERTWTIPYDPATPVFDKASPSIQLAGLSMLAGEKLLGGPLADAIDFKQLAAPRAAVKQFYGNSRRVGEMLTVVGALE